jgi:hypothetical protein
MYKSASNSTKIISFDRAIEGDYPAVEIVGFGVDLTELWLFKVSGGIGDSFVFAALQWLTLGCPRTEGLAGLGIRCGSGGQGIHFWPQPSYTLTV